MFKNIRFVYITTADKDEARKIGRILIEEKLAACVNILPGMESIYVWEGKIEEDTECVMIAKTHASKMKQLTQRVLEHHSYDCPCVASLSLAEGEGNPEYMDWIEANSKN